MATEILTIVRDDLDGTEGAEQVEFAIDGQCFTIDLGDKNQEKLRRLLAPFIAAAQPTSGPAATLQGRKLGKKAAAPGSAPNSAIRAWWRDEDNRTRHGLPAFNDRGRIPTVVQNAYYAVAK